MTCNFLFLLDLLAKPTTFRGMNLVRNLLLCSFLLLLPSCQLVQSVVAIPVGILKTAGRTVGVNNLTDAPAQPIADKQEKPAIGNDPVEVDKTAE